MFPPKFIIPLLTPLLSRKSVILPLINPLAEEPGSNFAPPETETV